MTKLYKNLPIEIKRILLISEGWLVGSAPEKLLNDEVPRDYDIVVPSAELFQLTCTLFAEYEVKINTFGGLKIKMGEIEVDVWVEELGHFIISALKCGYIYNLKSAKLLKLI